MGTAVERLADAIQHASRGAAFAFGVTPETLRVEGAEAKGDETAIAEAAAMLHDRDLIHILFVGAVPQAALHRLLHVLTLDAAERRQRGGPAKIWAAEGAPSIVLDQFDYEQLLAREHTGERAAAGRDGLWRSIVLSITASRRWSPSAILVSSRCSSGSSRRANRSARITRWCSRPSRRSAWCRAMWGSRRWPVSSPGAGFSGRRKLRTLKERGVGALARIGPPATQTVLADAAKTGDRLLRKIAAARR